MKILIASDIHGRLLAAQKLVAAITSLGVDKIVLLGDYLYNGPRNGVPSDYDGMAVANLLNPLAEKIIGVKGNCDAKIDQDILSFHLEDHRSVTLNGFTCVLLHGDNFSPSFVKAAKGDIVMSGHTHLPVLEEREGIIYLNPGSTSFPKGGNPASFAILSDDKLSILELETFRVMKTFSLTRLN